MYICILNSQRLILITTNRIKEEKLFFSTEITYSYCELNGACFTFVKKSTDG